jgi:hypothetical protein
MQPSASTPRVPSPDSAREAPQNKAADERPARSDALAREEAAADRMFAEGTESQALVRLAPFRLNSDRGSIIVVRIPVPAELRQDSASAAAVAFRVAAGTDARVIGRTRGLVAPGSATVRATLSLRRTSAAGRNTAASVEFRDTQGRRFLVPVEFDVAADRRVSFALDDDYISAARGTWTGIGFVVQNLGNGAEILSLHAELPQGWRSVTDGMPPQGTMAPGSTVRGLLRVWVPPQFAAGQARVRVLLRSGAIVMASREAHVSVDDAHGSVRPGPSAEVSMAAATGADGSRATGYAVTLDGAITDSVWLSARAALSDAGSGAAAYGLARAGIAIGPPSLSIRSPRIGLDAGAIGVQRSELSGYFLSGLGASADVKVGATTVGAFASRPYGFAQQSTFAAGDGRFAGVSIAHRAGVLGDASVQGVALRDAFGERELTAVTLSSQVPDVLGGELTTEVGYRAHADGAGAGASLDFHRAVGGSLIELRAVHAPGGSKAFARAVDDLSATLSQHIGPAVLLAAGAWRQHDQNIALGDFSSDGWFVAPSVDLDAVNSTLGLELRGSSFAATSQAGRFANDEQQLSAVLDSRFRAAYLTIRSGVAQLGRAIEFNGATLPDATGTRMDLRSALGINGTYGQFEAVYVAQQYGGEASLYPQQQSVSARVNNVHLPLLSSTGVLLNADVQRMVTGSYAAANWSARGGASASLPARLGTASLQVEYNPYLLAAIGGRAGLLYTMRLSRGITLPRLTAARMQRVFIDSNGDGVRNSGEPGARGVALRCGSLSVVTDDDGRFACSTGSRVVLDVRTLPAGVLAPAEGGASMAADAGIALRPVTVRTVRLLLAADDSTQVRMSDLDAVIVIARDSAGTVWVARSAGMGVFSFDALPSGTYVLDFDASAVAEPLRTPNPAPVLIVRPMTTAPVLEIEVRARTMRVKQLGSRGTPGRDAPARGSVGGSGSGAVTQEPRNRQRQ